MKRQRKQETLYYLYCSTVKSLFSYMRCLFLSEMHFKEAYTFFRLLSCLKHDAILTFYRIHRIHFIKSLYIYVPFYHSIKVRNHILNNIVSNFYYINLIDYILFDAYASFCRCLLTALHVV